MKKLKNLTAVLREEVKTQADLDNMARIAEQHGFDMRGQNSLRLHSYISEYLILSSDVNCFLESSEAAPITLKEFLSYDMDLKELQESELKTYTIKGKKYSEFDINKRCAEVMGLGGHGFMGVVVISERFNEAVNESHSNSYSFDITEYEYNPCESPSDTWPIIEKVWDDLMCEYEYNPCESPSDTWPIIEKVWDDLMCDFDLDYDYLTPKWEHIMDVQKCTKLVAACICFIESEGNKL